jgi:uncharacterized protein involved in propanediol utilization
VPIADRVDNLLGRPPGTTRQLDPSVQQGIGSCHAHHGEILQGVFPDRNIRHHHALVTLPCSLRASTAFFTAERDTGVDAGPDAWKAARSAEQTLVHLGVQGWGGTVEIRSTIPRGRGLGSSTADVVATARAVSQAFGRRLSPLEIGKIAVAAEGASDSLMYELPVLFAQREGVTLEAFPCSLPPFTVVGADFGGSGVDTLAAPQIRYDARERADFQVLRGALRRALLLGDSSLLAQVSTASALINQRHRPIAEVDVLLAEYGRCGAMGIQVAHSGTVAGVICPLGDHDVVDRAARRLELLGAIEVWRFDVGVC